MMTSIDYTPTLSSAAPTRGPKTVSLIRLPDSKARSLIHLSSGLSFVSSSLHLSTQHFNFLFMSGVNDFNPLDNSFKWANFDDTIVPGFSLQDRSIFRVFYCEQFTQTRTDNTEINLANQLITKQNCRGSFVVYKMDSIDSALRNDADAEDSSEAETSSQPGVTATKDSKGIKLIPLSRREIWGIINYRYECSSSGVVSDRIHRTNMQRTEALLALKKTGFTCVGPFNESGPSTYIR
jgi:hypothetical protein